MVTRSNKTIKNENTIQIRMYNVGFGDCILVRIPTKNGMRKILFDCGTICASPDISIEMIVKQIIKDVTEMDEVPVIDVIVATHRHRDHVSGFGNPNWNKVRVKEIWMPWTEDPADAEAKIIRDTQARLAEILLASIRKGALIADSTKKYNALRELAKNEITNERAMQLLHEGFNGSSDCDGIRRLFLPKLKDEDRILKTDALPGVKAHIIGPSRDKDVIKDMNPPLGESYFQLRQTQLKNGEIPFPFPKQWNVSCGDYELKAGRGVWPKLGKDDRRWIEKAGGDIDSAIAVALDKAINGTSLMVVLEIGNAYLLFPGDAQWGTWKAALSNPYSKKLLEKIRFYKVSHHGSNTGTPKEFIDEYLSPNVIAMVSTLSTKHWPNIPRKALIDSIQKRNVPIARSDEMKKIEDPFVSRNAFSIDVAIPLK